MGWKNLREHYRIGHIVQVRDGNVIIGSPYVLDLLTVHPSGEVTWNEALGPSGNADLTRYVAEMRADPSKVAELFATPDSFATSIPVYTYDGAQIIEKQCEEAGWPHVTHDGEMLYDNTSSTDKILVVRWAKQNARAGLRMADRRVIELRKDLATAREIRRKYEEHIDTLAADYPEVTLESSEDSSDVR